LPFFFSGIERPVKTAFALHRVSSPRSCVKASKHISATLNFRVTKIRTLDHAALVLISLISAALLRNSRLLPARARS
jgi:hypothetical protein